MKNQSPLIRDDINKLSKNAYNLQTKLHEPKQCTQRNCLEITSTPVVRNDDQASLVKE